MLPYLIAIGLIEGTRIIKLDSQSRRFFVSLFCASVFILLFGLRHPSMGQDLLYLTDYGYIGGFLSIARSPWEMDVFQNYEWGYILLNKLISVFTWETQAFLAICAACAILPFAYVIYKYSDDIQTSYIVFFGNPVFTMIFSGLRQAIAVGILFLTIGLIKNRRFLLFVMIVCLAAQFHSSAYIFLLAYPVYHIGSLSSRIIKTVLLAGLAIAFVLRRYLFASFAGLISSKDILDDNGAIKLFLLCLFFLIFLFYMVKTENKEINGFIKIYYLASLFMVFSSVNVLVLRVVFYFINILILLVPMLYMRNIQSADGELRSHSNAVLVLFVNLLCIALGLFFIITTAWAQAYPYVFFWE